jgi:hypothetical protein
LTIIFVHEIITFHRFLSFFAGQKMSRNKTKPTLADKAMKRLINSDQDDALFLESRDFVSTPSVEWLVQIFSSSAKESQEVFDPKAALYQCLTMLTKLLPDDETAETVIVNVNLLRSCIARLRLTADMFKNQPPDLFTNFQEGWMVDMENPTLYTRRQSYCRNAEMAYFDHLRAGLKIETLPLHCEPECGCQVQQTPVGDRGGLPRRVPCAQMSLKNAPNMSKTTIKFVSQHANQQLFLFCFISFNKQRTKFK